MLWEDKDEEVMLEEIRKLHAEDLNKYFSEYSAYYRNDDKAFSKYMRFKFKEKGISQRDAFKKARMSERYGYKLISQEKETSQRDVIIRLCLALRMDVNETQKALILSGFAVLSIYYRRDVILMVAINNKLFGIDEVNDFLAKHDEEKLYEGISKE